MAVNGPEIANLPFGWGAIFGFLNLLGLGAALTAWIKSRAANRRVELDGDEKLRSEMWRDIEALKAADQDKSRRLTSAETRIASQTVEIGQLRFISKLVVNEIERLDPGNVIAMQARVLLETVQPAAMPQDDEIAPMTELLAKIEARKPE